jgi:hypothetical protein
MVQLKARLPPSKPMAANRKQLVLVINRRRGTEPI